MNSVTAPSRAPASRTNFATSAVRSVKPAPGVCTVSCEETMLVAATVDGGVRIPSNPAVDILLHPVGNLDLAFALGDLRLALLQRVGFRHRLFDLAGNRRRAGGELRLELFIVGLQ